MKFWTKIALLLITCPTLASFTLPSYEASYKIDYRGNTIGSHSESLEYKNQNSYILKSKSQFQILWFHGELSTTTKGKLHHSRFQASSHTLKKGDKIASFYQLKNGANDLASAVLNCRSSLIRHETTCSQLIKFDSKNNPTRVKINLKTLSHRIISTKRHNFKTVKIEFLSRNSVITYWLAKNIYFIPVKVSINRNGKNFTQVLTSYRFMHTTKM